MVGAARAHVMEQISVVAVLIRLSIVLKCPGVSLVQVTSVVSPEVMALLI